MPITPSLSSLFTRLLVNPRISAATLSALTGMPYGLCSFIKSRSFPRSVSFSTNGTVLYPQASHAISALLREKIVLDVPISYTLSLSFDKNFSYSFRGILSG